MRPQNLRLIAEASVDLRAVFGEVARDYGQIELAEDRFPRLPLEEESEGLFYQLLWADLLTGEPPVVGLLEGDSMFG